MKKAAEAARRWFLHLIGTAWQEQKAQQSTLASLQHSMRALGLPQADAL